MRNTVAAVAAPRTEPTAAASVRAPAEPAPVTPVLLTVEDAARALSLGRTKVYELLDAGLLRSVKIGRARRLPVDGLVEFARLAERGH
jgi:excisionase family DNA binding protein